MLYFYLRNIMLNKFYMYNCDKQFSKSISAKCNLLKVDIMQVFLADEISLADDSVIERSVYPAYFNQFNLIKLRQKC